MTAVQAPSIGTTLGVRRAAIAAAAGYAIVVAFQIALAAGAPLGKAAWGGQSSELGVGYRIGSGVAAILWTAAGVAVLARVRILPSRLTDRVLHRIVWLLVGLAALGVLVNLASSSRWERFGWAPFLVVHAALLLVVARGADRTT